jgi:ligand-binding SRPBCC domain-containing protein
MVPNPIRKGSTFVRIKNELGTMTYNCTRFLYIKAILLLWDTNMNLHNTKNRKLVTRQTDGPFKKWESIQEFQGNGNTTHIRHTIEYELPTSGKIANTLSGNQADNKIKQGLEQAAQTVKQKLESGQV